MKKISVIDDITKSEIEEPIEVTISRDGYMIEYPKGVTSNVLKLDTTLDSLSSILSKIKFIRNTSPSVTNVEIK